MEVVAGMIALLAAVLGLARYRAAPNEPGRDELVRRVLQHMKRIEIARLPGGPSGVLGTAIGAPLRAPWTGRTCIAYRLDVFTYVGHARHLVARDQRCGAFELQDDTGTMRVEAEQADVLPAEAARTAFHEPAQLPPAAVALLQARSAWPPPYGLWVEELLIEPGDRVAAFGVVDRVVDNRAVAGGYRDAPATRLVLRRSLRYPLAVSNERFALCASGRELVDVPLRGS